LICLLKTQQVTNETKGSILRQDEDTKSRAEEKLDVDGDKIRDDPSKIISLT